MNGIILENPNFPTRNCDNLKSIKQVLEAARNLRNINKCLDNNFISLNEAILTNTSEEIKMQKKNLVQENEICYLKEIVSIENDRLFELKDQLNLRKLSEFFFGFVLDY